MVLTCLLWTLCFAVTLQSPFQRATLSEGMAPLEVYEASRSSYYRLPMFRHAPGPLVAHELFRPVPLKKQLPQGLEALLLPPTHPHHGSPQPRGRAVDVWCGLGTISVRVDRSQLSAWPVPSLMHLGSCQARKVTPQSLYFHHRLTECGGESKISGGQLVYTFFLRYTPPIIHGYVIRVPPLNLPVQCHYNRFYYSYQVGYRPQVQDKTFIKSIRNKHTFNLTVYNAQWKPLLPGHLVFLGEPVYFVARTSSLLAGERLYVDSCHITASQDPNSTPKLDIITNYGCMTDSQREGSSSRFLSAEGSEVLFTVDSFIFSGVSQLLYLHCSMSISLTTSQSSKSCNYNKNLSRWEELGASPSACFCCDSLCSDVQDSVKYTGSISSPGLYFRQHTKGSPSMTARSFQSEKGNEWVAEEDKGGKTMDEKLEEKGDQIYPPRTEICHEEEQKKKACIVPAEKKEKSHSTTVSQQGNSSAVMASTNASTNSTSGIDDDKIKNHQNASTAVIPVSQHCSNGDALSCPDTNTTAKEYVSSSNEHSYISVEDASGLESTILEGLFSHKMKPVTSMYAATGDSATDPPTFKDTIARSDAHLVDFSHFARSIGPDEDMVDSLQIQELNQSTLPVEVRDPVWVSRLLGSNLGPQIDDESPHQSQFTAAVETKKRDFSDDFSRPVSVGSNPVGPEQMSSPSHSATVTFVSASQGTRGNQLTDSELRWFQKTRS